jgi:predicted nucleic acid-binding protein
VSTVFADTYFFLGIINRADDAHARCQAFCWDYRGEILTTAYIVVELADALASPPHRMAAAQYIRLLQNNPQVRLIQASITLLEQGLALYTRRSDKDWSLTDCISFVVMKEEGIAEALTGDRHFEQVGFVALLK